MTRPKGSIAVAALRRSSLSAMIAGHRDKSDKALFVIVFAVWQVGLVAAMAILIGYGLLTRRGDGQ